MYGLQGDIRLKVCTISTSPNTYPDGCLQSEATRLASAISEREPHITVLFNNAGISAGAVSKPTEATASAFVKAYFDDIKPEDFTDVLNTNAVGPYWLTFAFLPLLEKWKREENQELNSKFVPQVIMTSSMNGWTKVGILSFGASFC